MHDGREEPRGVLPDANKEQTLSKLVGASFGAAGQRCMAGRVAVLVGAAKQWIPELRRQGERTLGPWDVRRRPTSAR